MVLLTNHIRAMIDNAVAMYCFLDDYLKVIKHREDKQYVKPAVENDGGVILFRSFKDGVVKLQLSGSCSGCPSSTLTLKSAVEQLLTRMVPEVKEVQQEMV
jgi:Fe-S cluster biogenesis protein NfuA